LTNIVTSEGKLCLFPEGGDESSASLCALEPGASDGAKFVEISGTEVRQLMLFPMSPEVFQKHGDVEAREIGTAENPTDNRLRWSYRWGQLQRSCLSGPLEIMPPWAAHNSNNRPSATMLLLKATMWKGKGRPSIRNS
jgi:hypothetical protein